MKNSLGLYFQLEVQERNQAFSLVRQSLKKIEQMEDAGIQVEYLQLRARELSGLRADKEIWLKIDSDKGTYIASGKSMEWNQALSNTVKNVEERILCNEADYTRHAALVEMSLPAAVYSPTAGV